MDWFTPWPTEALVAVSDYFFSEFPVVCSPEVKASLIKTMGTYHDKVSETCESYFERYVCDVRIVFIYYCILACLKCQCILFFRFRRRTHVTPKSYLSFISGYKSLYIEKYEFINTLAERMNVGK